MAQAPARHLCTSSRAGASIAAPEREAARQVLRGARQRSSRVGAAVSFSWKNVAENLLLKVSLEAQKPSLPSELREEHDPEGNYQRLDAGQRASLSWIARRLSKGGVVLADEVGTGKTRIACAVAHAVL